MNFRSAFNNISFATAVVALDVFFSAVAFAGIDCKHYWDTENGLLASDREVGVDVGKSPYGMQSGAYLCTVSVLTQREIFDLYVYLGEIGDASRLEIIRADGRMKIISHGLVNGELPRYTRYVPFVVPLSELLDEPGIVNFRVIYKDIFPMQIGMRSGHPSVESFWGSIGRFVDDKPAFTIHLLQIFAFLLMSLVFASWPGLETHRRWLLSITSIFASAALIQLTAIPRSFFSVTIAMYLNDFIQLISLSLSTYVSLSFLGPFSKQSTRRLFLILAVGVIATIILMLSIGERNTMYLSAYALGGVFGAVIPNTYAAYLIFRGRIFLSTTPKPSRWAASIFCLSAGAYGMDVLNLVVFQSRFPYVSHFTFFTSTTIFFFWALRTEHHAHLAVFKRIGKIKSELIGSLSRFERTGSELLGDLCREVAMLIASGRVSILSRSGGKSLILGCFGKYVATNVSRSMAAGNAFEAPDSQGVTLFGRAPSVGDPGRETAYMIAPLGDFEEESFYICATDFAEWCIHPFWAPRIQAVVNDLSLVMQLIHGYKVNQDKGALIDMLRSYIHPLQIKTESFFLSHHEIGKSRAPHFLIVGDMVSSTYLNEKFGADRVRKVMEGQMEHAWETLKDLGFVISLNKGDFVSITVPCLASETSPRETAKRAYLVLEALANIGSNEIMRKIQKEAGIPSLIQYRFAMTVTSSDSEVVDSDGKGVKSFQVLADSAIDTLFRVLNYACQPGECLVVDPAQQFVPDDSRIIALAPRRFKGKPTSKVVALLDTSVGKRAI